MKVHLRPGTPLIDVNRRQLGRGFWLSSLSTDGVVAASSQRARATATASATPHTKGAWQEVIAATTKDATGLTLTFTSATSAAVTDTSTLLDIGIGGAGSEAVIVPNLAAGFRLANDRVEVPVLVPGGSRVSIRAQSAVASQSAAVEVALTTLPFGRRSPNHLIAIGADTATSRGVALPAGGATHTKTAWVELTASVAEPLGAIIIGEQLAGDSVVNGGTCLVDIGVGAAGSEVVVVPDAAFAFTSNETVIAMSERTFPVDMAMGARIAARWQFSSAANSLDIVLTGVPRQ